MTCSSEPSRLPSRSVRVSSRLRRVISSSASVSAAAVGGQPGDVAERRLLRLAQVGHQGAGGLDLDGAVVDAEAGQGRRAEVLEEGLAGLLGLEVPRRPGVTASPAWPRSARTQGASRLSSEIKVSAGLSRAISSASSVRETPVSENRPVESSTQARPSLPPDLDDRRQVVGRLGVEQLVVGERARA